MEITVALFSFLHDVNSTALSVVEPFISQKLSSGGPLSRVKPYYF